MTLCFGKKPDIKKNDEDGGFIITFIFCSFFLGCFFKFLIMFLLFTEIGQQFAEIS